MPDGRTLRPIVAYAAPPPRPCRNGASANTQTTWFASPWITLIAAYCTITFAVAPPTFMLESSRRFVRPR